MQLPLLFSLQHTVNGNGFMASVHMNGRALLEEREATADCAGECWISGVAPVGFSGGGADRNVAYVEFRNAWLSVLFDIASEAKSFEEFKHACCEFLDGKSPTVTKEWESALAETRRRQYVDPNLPSRPIVAITFGVVNLTGQVPTPTENTLESGLLAAA